MSMLEAKFQETGRNPVRPAANYLYPPVCSDLSLVIHINEGKS